jgi:hypothetical protein
MHKRALAPDVQVPHAALFDIMQLIRDLAAIWTNGHRMRVRTENVQYVPRTVFLKRIFRDYRAWQS